jgi:hypothetical protein
MNTNPRLLLLFLLASTSALSATEPRQMSGRIEALTDTRVVIRHGSEKLEVPREGLQISEGVKVGDSVTVWYKPQVERIELRKRKQEAGEAAPKDAAPVDDRAFYPAKNQVTPSHPFGNGSRALNRADSF